MWHNSSKFQPSFQPTKTLSASLTTLGKLKVHACRDINAVHFKTVWTMQVKAPRSFCTSSHPRTLESSAMPLWEPHISHLQQCPCDSLTSLIFSNAPVTASLLSSSAIPLWQPHISHLQQCHCDSLTFSSSAIPLWQPNISHLQQFPCDSLTSRIFSNAPVTASHSHLQQFPCDSLTSLIFSNATVTASHLSSSAMPLWQPHISHLQQYHCGSLTSRILWRQLLKSNLTS